MTGFYAMSEHLAMQFTSEALGVEIPVDRVDLTYDLTNDDRLASVCSRGKSRQRIPILDLPSPNPPPEGSEWLEPIAGSSALLQALPAFVPELPSELQGAALDGYREDPA